MSNDDTEIVGRVAIAAACKWRDPGNRSNPLYFIPKHIPGQTLASVDMTQPKDWVCGFPPNVNILHELPDYFNDLNAMRESLMAQTLAFRRRFETIMDNYCAGAGKLWCELSAREYATIFLETKRFE